MGSKKRSRPTTDKVHAECPFIITYVDHSPEAKQKQPKRKRTDASTEKAKSIVQRVHSQSFEFLQPTADVHYTIHPCERWLHMTRYASFVQDGTKYAIGDFAMVANEQSVKRQCTKAQPDAEQSNPDWIARILEIRASDTLHVYARVAWMYWPYELPSTGNNDTHQYGPREVVMSNHMDIINVMSVTTPAKVRRWIEADDDGDGTFYYRQAFNCRNRVVSTVDS
ncbi:hypothetical protein FGRMN_5539 [Fusarium graminum]|nr:hypothetical protein FGRMN_5539 [Fusarium graminum]